MSETTTTAVARPTVPAAIAAKIDERRAINEVARQIANLSWGKGLSEPSLRAIAEYARRYRIDAASELDVLGGKLYRNANYFIRRGAELLRRGIVTDIAVEHVNTDPRLDALLARQVPGAQEELDRRTLARIKHNIPDAAKGAVVVRITLSSGAIVEGANYAGVDKDPVGSANPGKTAESRAYRRAWRLLVDTIPALKEEEGELDGAGVEVAAKIADVEAERVERNNALPLNNLRLAAPTDGAYGLEETPRREPVVVDDEPTEAA